MRTFLKSKASSWSELLLAITIGLIIFIIFSAVRSWENENLTLQLEKSASAYQSLFLSKINSHISELKALQRFYDASKFIDRKEFGVFTRGVFTDNPSLHSFQWIPVVPHAKRRQLESAHFNKGLGGRIIYESPEHDLAETRIQNHQIYYPIVYVEPIEQHREEVGYNLGANPVVLSLIEQVRDSGEIGISSDIVQLQHNQQHNLTIIANPIYKKNVVLNTLEQRRSHFKGVVLLEFDTGLGLEEAISGLTPSGLHISVIDLTAPVKEQLLYIHRSRTTDDKLNISLVSGKLLFNEFNHILPINFPGKKWILKFNPAPAFYKLHPQWRAWSVLVVSVFLAVIIFSYLRFNLRRTTIIEELVESRTSELQASEKYQHTILNTIADAIITIDNKGQIVSFNPAAENIFGYESDKTIGNNISMLLPENDQAIHQSYTDNSKIHSSRIINKSRDLFGRRKDGSLFPLELIVSPIQEGEWQGFVGVMRDITERQRVDKMKNEFVSTVSHELRTPLTSIRGSLGLLNGGVLGKLPEQAEEVLRIAVNNTERLLLLINDILDIQKIESGEMVLNFESFKLQPFLEQAIEDNAAYGEQHGIRFVIENPSSEVQIYADKSRMMQVITNLLANAAKFSPDNEVVTVSFTRNDNNIIRISIIDHGCGIPEEFHSKLFNKFTQSDSSDSRQKGGTGLGLNISQAIIEKHNGKIGFVSKEGKGSTFYIELSEFNIKDS